MYCYPPTTFTNQRWMPKAKVCCSRCHPSTPAFHLNERAVHQHLMDYHYTFDRRGSGETAICANAEITHQNCSKSVCALREARKIVQDSSMNNKVLRLIAAASD